jgi:hypothetical protein
MKLKNIILNERSQTQKIIYLYEMSRIGIETESQLVVSRCWRGRGKASDCSLGTGFPLWMIKILDNGNGFKTL